MDELSATLLFQSVAAHTHIQRARVRPSAAAAFDLLNRAFCSACSIIARSIVERSAGSEAAAFLLLDDRQSHRQTRRTTGLEHQQILRALAQPGGAPRGVGEPLV
jgi:methylphosphotriester-DNA--protein-cysteine methyltransferase